MLPGNLVPMPNPSRTVWMLQPFPPGAALTLGPSPGSIGRWDHQPPHCSSPLPARLPWLQFTRSLLHCCPVSVGVWASPRHSASKTKAKPKASCRDTGRSTACIVSLESLVFSLSLVKIQFLSPHHRATAAVGGAGGDLSLATQLLRPETPTSHTPAQEAIHCLRPLPFQRMIIQDDNTGKIQGELKKNMKSS